MTESIDPSVVRVIKDWASASPERAADVLTRGRLTLDGLLVSQLVGEVAEVSAEQLIVLLDMPSEKQSKDEPAVPFLGMELNQQQGQRVKAWLDDLQELAPALGLSVESWSEKFRDGMQRVLENLRGRPLGDVASQVAHSVADGALASATKGFQGGVDPSQSEFAGLRGIFAARDFGKKKS